MILLVKRLLAAWAHMGSSANVNNC